MSQAYDDALASAVAFGAARGPATGYMQGFYEKRKWSDGDITSMKITADTNNDTLASDLCAKLLLVPELRRARVWMKTREYFDT